MPLRRCWSTRVWLLCLIIWLPFLYFFISGRYKLSQLNIGKFGRFPWTSADFETPPLGEHGVPSPENSNNEFQLSTWLKSRGITPDVIPVITISDSKYLRAMHSLRSRLEIWGYGQNLVVLCLDVACAEDKTLNGYPGYMQDDEKVMHSVASLKVCVQFSILQDV
jgi:hypothetical protein